MSRRIWDFPGGIHPPQKKSLSNQTPIKAYIVPKYLVIPLQQHIGAPAKPIVSVGDYVLKGQKIAEAVGFVSAPVHASSSGLVVEIGPRPVQHPSQIDGQTIVIETDAKDQWIEHHGLANYLQAPIDEIRQAIREAGIAGMGGAGFPTAIKLSPNPKAIIETLIINAVECEPYITSDDLLMREHADEVIRGIQIMSRLLNPKSILIGIEDNKPDAIKAMRLAVDSEGNSSHNIEIVVVPTKYPSGGEKQLIQILTGKEVRSGGIPADIGVVCQNVGTTHAIYCAVAKGEPLIKRVTTLTGEAIDNPGNTWTLIGTPAIDLLKQASVREKDLSRLIMGGPMMGFTLHDTAIPVVKTTNCLLASTPKELPSPTIEQACIRCSSCAQVCPIHLLPQQMYWYSKSKEFDKAQNYNLFDCIECGACSFVCPSNIPLVQYFRFAKGEIRKLERDSKKSDHARERFEFRQARLEKEQAEKEAKRKARSEKAAKAQAEKKNQPPSATSVSSPPQSTDDQLKALKTAVAKTAKMWKDAEKALSIAESSATEDQQEQLEIHRSKVERLKLKANNAQRTLTDFKAGKAASANPSLKDNSVNDALSGLKQTSAKDFQAYQDAKLDLDKAQSANAEEAEIAKLQQHVNDLKKQSDSSKAAMKHAREEERQKLRQATEVIDPMEMLKKSSANAFEAYQMAKEALEKAQAAGNADIEKLKVNVDKLKATSDRTKEKMKAARAKQKEAMRNQLADDPKKQLTIDVASAKAKLKKAQKAIAAAEVDDSNSDPLRDAVKAAQLTLDQAQAALNDYEAKN